MFVSVVVRDLFSLVSWLIIFVIMIIFVYISVVCVVRFLLMWGICLSILLFILERSFICVISVGVVLIG